MTFISTYKVVVLSDTLIKVEIDIYKRLQYFQFLCNAKKTNVDQFGLIWTNLDQFGKVYTSLVKSRPSWKGLNKFEQVWTSLDKFEQV